MASDSFGEFLIQEGWIRREQLNMAIALQQEIGGDIGEVLVALSILTSQQVSNIRRKWMDDNTIAIPLVPAPQEFLASFGIESPPDLVSLEKLFALDISTTLLSSLPYKEALSHKVLLRKIDRNHKLLYITASEKLPEEIAEWLKQEANAEFLHYEFAAEEDLITAIRYHYGRDLQPKLPKPTSNVGSHLPSLSDIVSQNFDKTEVIPTVPPPDYLLAMAPQRAPRPNEAHKNERSPGHNRPSSGYTMAPPQQGTNSYKTYPPQQQAPNRRPPSHEEIARQVPNRRRQPSHEEIARQRAPQQRPPSHEEIARQRAPQQRPPQRPSSGYATTPRPGQRPSSGNATIPRPEQGSGSFRTYPEQGSGTFRAHPDHQSGSHRTYPPRQQTPERRPPSHEEIQRQIHRRPPSHEEIARQRAPQQRAPQQRPPSHEEIARQRAPQQRPPQRPSSGYATTPRPGQRPSSGYATTPRPEQRPSSGNATIPRPEQGSGSFRTYPEQGSGTFRAHPDHQSGSYRTYPPQQQAPERRPPSHEEIQRQVHRRPPSHEELQRQGLGPQNTAQNPASRYTPARPSSGYTSVPTPAPSAPEEDANAQEDSQDLGMHYTKHRIPPRRPVTPKKTDLPPSSESAPPAKIPTVVGTLSSDSLPAANVEEQEPNPKGQKRASLDAILSQYEAPHKESISQYSLNATGHKERVHIRKPNSAPKPQIMRRKPRSGQEDDSPPEGTGERITPNFSRARRPRLIPKDDKK
ncbi:MAG: hypothetical protein CL920_15510 [Deltaproteobacteria bacterium]|nr:hypothetical protein [Deltaproteobacteria bacterium]MBU50095.1 hypothetical protein [Deltaproteobacteria bacterium]